MEPFIEETKKYLGGGIYISYDGYSVIFQSEREEILTLEPEILTFFIKWLEGIGIVRITQSSNKKANQIPKVLSA